MADIMRVGFAVVLLVAVVLAGCAESSAPEPDESEDETFESFDETAVDDEHGAIRGVVVNDAIVPVEGASVVLDLGGDSQETVTDAEGRFTFTKIPAGTYFLEVSKNLHEAAQASVVVEAGVKEPPVVKVQIPRLYTQDPYWEIAVHFQGYFTCAYNLFVSSTCVNDYTRVDPTGTCPGGCFPELAGAVDHREYVTPLGGDWQTIQIEMVWDQSLAGTSDTMGMTISYFERVGASHRWFSGSGESPMIARLDASAVGGTEDQFPDKIPYSGIDDLFVFMSAGGGQVSVQQEFEIFHSHSYYAPLPEGWSFVNGDGDPFGDG